MEKDDNQFQKYYHSTQKAWRQRSVCTPCFYEQKKQYRELKKEMKSTPIIDPNLIKCAQCNQYKSLDEYYIKNKVRCKRCILDNDRKRRAVKYVEKGGNDRVPIKPNTYADNIQKENTFELMTALGYTFNEENGIWYKLPWKTPDGKFPLLGPTVKRSKMIKKTWVKRTDKELERIADLKKLGWSDAKISKELNIPKISVYKWLKKRNT